jgi:hypothetical protein
LPAQIFSVFCGFLCKSLFFISPGRCFAGCAEFSGDSVLTLRARFMGSMAAPAAMSSMLDFGEVCSMSFYVKSLSRGKSFNFFINREFA